MIFKRIMLSIIRKEVNGMSKVCAITGKGPLSGNKRSHSMRASRRNWNVNLQKVKVVVDGKPQTIISNPKEQKSAPLDC